MFPKNMSENLFSARSQFPLFFYDDNVELSSGPIPYVLHFSREFSLLNSTLFKINIMKLQFFINKISSFRPFMLTGRLYKALHITPLIQK